VKDIQELAAAMKQVKRPVIVTFMRKRRRKKKYNEVPTTKEEVARDKVSVVLCVKEEVARDKVSVVLCVVSVVLCVVSVVLCVLVVSIHCSAILALLTGHIGHCYKLSSTLFTLLSFFQAYLAWLYGKQGDQSSAAVNSQEFAAVS
jgi:hypothetical protein